MNRLLVKRMTVAQAPYGWLILLPGQWSWTNAGNFDRLTVK